MQPENGDNGDDESSAPTHGRWSSSAVLSDLISPHSTDPKTTSTCKVVCLTGGPCGGKTSALSILSDLFRNLGWKVYRVPETATHLLSGGVVFSELSPQQTYSFQKDLLTVMLSIENTYINLAKLNAKQGQKTIVITDRGAMDPSAYIDRASWLKILAELNLDEISIRDHRYDCVVHLVTAAKGAEQFYTLSNNSVRSEGLELARHLDNLVMNAWLGHASLQVIDNESVPNFTAKCDRIVQAVLTRLGVVADNEIYGRAVMKHKFVVRDFVLTNEFPVPFRDFEVEHIYLVNPTGDGSQIRIRRRSEQLSAEEHLSMTMRRVGPNGQMAESRRNLTHREYDILRGQNDPTRSIVKKIRRCFLFNDRYFQLDVFQSTKHAGLMMLEGYLDYDSEETTNGAPAPGVNQDRLPPWLQVEEVTKNKEYSMYELAKI
ncbi:AAA domain-containing protein [Polychytrium aggregatum]|uniref:AAA domain-containing protein n=1 Tax=Polychytrium aggregatum TaxID=110093 RepID=UPI0022FF21BA|nr:AAA domain-containing protein [Polychytrium aggregatum]KAI9206704.1 AAA domain-containing protein [Polychytrium aggregatum]